MSRLTIINDTHLGVVRSAGTTPASAQALVEWQEKTFEDLVLKFNGGDMVILGDLFDSFTVSYRALLHAYNTLSREFSGNDATLHLVAGNHDLAKDSNKLGALHLLFVLLDSAGVNVRLHTVPGWIQQGVWVIPHQPNQDLFDIALEEVPPQAKAVLLHANYANSFAQAADHSLNVSEEQAAALPGWVIFAHEHQFRTAQDDKVIVIGNQIPTSVSDCLGPDFKYYAVYDQKKDGVELVPYFTMSSIFTRLDWTDLASYDGDAKFIRVEGNATEAQSADAVSAIANLRRKCDAFVITNAVQVEGTRALDGLPETLEKAKEFDVFEAVMQILEEDERAVVRKVMQEAP